MIRLRRIQRSLLSCKYKSPGTLPWDVIEPFSALFCHGFFCFPGGRRSPQQVRTRPEQEDAVKHAWPNFMPFRTTPQAQEGKQVSSFRSSEQSCKDNVGISQPTTGIDGSLGRQLPTAKRGVVNARLLASARGTNHTDLGDQTGGRAPSSPVMRHVKKAEGR